jgi:Flp pilus assembly protein TadB
MWAYIPVAMGTALAVYMYRVVTKWSRSSQWSTTAALALVGGALIGHTLFGLLAARLEVIDRIGLVVVLGLTAWLMYRLYHRQTKRNALEGTL